MKALAIAKTLIGQREGKNNTFDSTTPLGRAMISRGHVNGQPWCGRCTEYCVVAAYPDRKDLDKALTPGAVESFSNLKKAGYKVVDVTKDKLDPNKDYVVAWQSYKGGAAQWTGHIGLLDPKSVKGVDFKSVEGNAAEKGVTREGVMVAEVAHKADALAFKVNDGLRLLGVIEI